MGPQSSPPTRRVPELSAGIGVNGFDGVFNRSELLELWAEHGHDGVLADLSDPTGWPPSIAVIAESLYCVSTNWLVGASTLKARGSAGDLVFTVTSPASTPAPCKQRRKGGGVTR